MRFSVNHSRAIVFECEQNRLVGILHVGDQPADGDVGVVIVVGGPQYRVGSHRQFVHLARRLADNGYPTLRFDYRGMGDAEGTALGFEFITADIRAAIDTILRERPELSGVVLFGLCDAASAALMYCASDHRVRGLVLANPWVRTAEGEAQSFVRHYYWRRALQPSFWGKALRGELRVRASIADLGAKVAASCRSTGAQKEPTAESFIGRMRAGLEASDQPMLVLTSEHDLTAREFSDLCRSDPRWRRAMARANVRNEHLENCDHTFSTLQAKDLVAARVCRWLEHALPKQRRLQEAAV